MIQAIKDNEVTLAQLEETFRLERADDRTFCPEWQENLPASMPIEISDKQRDPLMLPVLELLNGSLNLALPEQDFHRR